VHCVQVYDAEAMSQLTEDDVEPYFVPDASRNTCGMCGDKFQLIMRSRVGDSHTHLLVGPQS
jgi:hypothetical protein